MVERPPSSEGLPDRPATDTSSSTGHSQGNQSEPSVLVGTFNISEQGDGSFPDLSRIVSAVLGSFGIANVESGIEGIDLRQAAPERLSRTPGLGGLRNSNRQQPDEAAVRGQSIPHTGASSLPTAVPLDLLHPQVIPDSLTTLSQYLGRMRQEFSAYGLAVSGQSNHSQAAGTHESDGLHSVTASQLAAGRRGLPTPASLAEVILSTRQILNAEAGNCLSQLARQLEDHANVTDLSERMRIQSNAMRSGHLLQKLGALLLELARTTMTLQMGEMPADAVVNAGPAVFISTSDPNPIMVQPLPFQQGMNFGAVPVGSVQAGSGLSVGSSDPGFLPRNIDIRIRTGSLISSATNQRESTGSQPPEQIDPAASGGGNPVDQAASAAIRSSSSTRESGVHIVPMRTVVAAVPAPVGRVSSEPSRGALGIFYPVLARVQHAISGNLNSTSGSQASDERHSRDLNTGRQGISDSDVQQQNIGVPGVDGTVDSGSGISNGQEFSAQGHSGFDQLLRTIFPGEQIHDGDISFQGMDTSSGSGHVGTAQGAANTQEAAPRVGDEGTFFSNMLHHIMPMISQNVTIGSTISTAEGASVVEDRTTQASPTQAQGNPDRGTSSHQRHDPPSESSSKRQKGLDDGFNS
ncbi:unnamed protein product [Ilex paraguariensis]|uniref:Uncharacterized protein n=1 Tax=Ilex paraguariensis TaxID=185542 RepID=A0ABC8QPR9_9AQUA